MNLNIFKKKTKNLELAYCKALEWINSNSIPEKGIATTSKIKVAYPEVTGYYIPTLMECGEKIKAVSFSKWLISIQQPDGSWLAPNNIPYTFDTGQILKGLLAVSDILPDAKEPLIKGCKWIINQIQEDGRVTTPDTSMWMLPNGKIVPEATHLYALQPIKQVGEKYGIPEFRTAVEKAINYYTSKKEILEFNTLSHFHAYILEALIDLDKREFVREAVVNLKKNQRTDGSIPAYKDVKWICSTGMAQYAVVLYKMGDEEPAKKILNYLAGIQNDSGGFYGSYGRNSNYFPNEEISWAVKYFLDAYNLNLLHINDNPNQI